MKMHLSIPSAILAVTVLLLQGCSAPKEVAPTFTADPNAFSYGVSQTAEMQLYTRECSKLGGNIKELADAASAAWYQRNWPQSHAADLGYSQQLASQKLNYNNETVALAAVKLYADIEKNILLKLDQSRHSLSSVTDTCTRRLNGYKDGTLDLAQNKNADLYLKSLVSTTPAVHNVPMLAGSLQPSSAPGRSQYNLEKTLAEWDCANGEVMTLRNDWPYEVYGAFCTSGKTVFITCEWGECKVQQ